MRKFLEKSRKAIVIVGVIALCSYATTRALIGESLSLSGYTVTGIKTTLSENSNDNLATQAAVKAAIDAVSLSAGNALNAISIEDYGAVVNSTSTGSKNANVSAFNSAISAAADGQLIIVPDGTYDFNDTIIASSTSKKFNILIFGNVRGPGIILEGNFHTFKAIGNILGNNSGADDSTEYAAYTDAGIYARNCINCMIEFNGIYDYKYGLKLGGESITTPKGTQYTSAFGSKIKNCYAQVYITTVGMTDGTEPGDNGNWCNGNSVGVMQVGGYHPSNNAANGIFGLLIQMTSGSNQGDPFNRNNFSIFYEGVLHGIKAEKANFNNFWSNSFEFAKVTYKINLREDNTSSLGCFNNKFYGGVIYESFFVGGGRGITTTTPQLIDDNGVPSADLSFWNGAGGYINLVGDEPTSRTSTRDMWAIGGMGGNWGEWNAAHVIREGTSTNDYVPLRGKTVTTTASSYSVAINVRVVRVNYTSGTATITLPTASSFPERDITVKNIHGSNNVSCNSETLTPGQAITWHSNGTSWDAIARF